MTDAMGFVSVERFLTPVGPFLAAALTGAGVIPGRSEASGDFGGAFGNALGFGVG
jgi:hypothetical protein